MTDNEMILKALVEYEDNHWETEDDDWQEQINNLISRYAKMAYKKERTTK